MKIVSNSHLIIEWQTSGDNLSGTSYSKDSTLILLKPEKSNGEGLFEIDCVKKVLNVNGNYAKCNVRINLCFKNNRKPPEKEELYNFIKDAYIIANKLSIEKQGMSDFSIVFIVPSLDKMNSELQSLIDLATKWDIRIIRGNEILILENFQIADDSFLKYPLHRLQNKIPFHSQLFMHRF